MADTGAPWNLPYPLPTDLVRDGADAIKDLAEAVAAGLDLAGGLVQIQYASRTTSFSTTSTSLTDVTDLDVSITPTDEDHDIYVLAGFVLGQSQDSVNRAEAVVARNTTTLGRVAMTNQGLQDGVGRTVLVKDPAASTSARTYVVRLAALDGGTAYIGRGRGTADDNFSYIIAMEVKV